MSYTIMISFTATIFLLLSSISNVIASPSLLGSACNSKSYAIDTNLCMQLLQSDPKITSKTNLQDLSIAIMESGISKAMGTQAYIEGKLKAANLTPDLKEALVTCKSSFVYAIASLKSALGEVQDSQEYETASYDLGVIAADAIGPCQQALTSNGIKDDILLNGVKALDIFGNSANIAIDILYKQSK